MSSSVEILIKDPRDSASLAYEIACVLRADGFFVSTDGIVLSIPAQPWINSSGRGTIDLKPVESGQGEEPGEYDGTAYAPYDHELTIEFHGGHGLAYGELRDRFGQALFDRMASMERPLAYGEVGGDLFADFLPGRGFRDFPPGTDYEEPGRNEWFEPQLHANSFRSEPIEPPEQFRGQGVVFERDGLVQMVPLESAGDGSYQFAAPVVSIRTEDDPARIGHVLALALRHPCANALGDPADWITGITRRSADEFSREAISLDVQSDGSVITLRPRLRYDGAPVERPSQGATVQELTYRGELPEGNAELGKLLLRTISALRHHADEQA